MTPERVAERVALLIEVIRGGISDAFAEHNAALTIDYIRQVHDMALSMPRNLRIWCAWVNEAVDSWYPKVDKEGQPLED